MVQQSTKCAQCPYYHETLWAGVQILSKRDVKSAGSNLGNVYG